MKLRVFLKIDYVDGWVANRRILFEDRHFHVIRLESGESPLEALHRAFGKCTVEVFS